MRLEHLCDMELGYQGGFTLIQPYASEEGTGFGTGEGIASGDQLAGRIRWVNHPQRRSDGVMLPNAHGVITTGDGAPILFTLQGRTMGTQTTLSWQGQHLLTALFEAEDERYRWLNTTLCIAEGRQNPETMRFQLHIYTCLSDQR
ncbi:MAG TPA: DUF3237 family protein [Ktedonobacterales bacterium]|jgi:hypothetical protein